MRFNIFYGLTLFIFLTTGCATARVWQREDSNIPSSRKEIETALFRCEQTPDVQTAHKRANAWDTVSTSTILIPFVGLAMQVTEESAATQYENCLIECMKRAGYIYHKETSNKLKWNKMSNIDTSMEQWNKEHPKNQLTSTPITPSSSKTKIDTVTWTFANIRSGAGNEFPVVATVKQGDKLTVIGEQREWFNVRLEDGKEGWINSRAAKRQEYAPEKPLTSTPITPSSGTTKIFTWDFSVVKSGPGNDYPVITTVRKGDKLIMMEQSREWVKVRLGNGQEGWIRSEVLE